MADRGVGRRPWECIDCGDGPVGRGRLRCQRCWQVAENRALARKQARVAAAAADVSDATDAMRMAMMATSEEIVRALAVPPPLLGRDEARESARERQARIEAALGPEAM